MIAVIGEVLTDLFPDYTRIGGAPFNVAFHLKKLGMPVRLFTRVGDDEHGHRIVAVLQENGFDAADIQIDTRHSTGRVRVSLDGKGVPRFDICTDAAYDHLDPGVDIRPDGADVELAYFGSLIQRTDAGRRRVQAWLDRLGDRVHRLCDINLRPPHFTSRVVAGSLRRTDLLKLNDAELATIRGLLDGPHDPDACIRWLMPAFAIDAVALTRGSRGSTLYHGGNRWDMPPVRVVDLVDTVGAGDGFCAVLIAGYLRRRPWAEVLARASRFASSICGIPGAIPDDDGIYSALRTWIG